MQIYAPFGTLFYANEVDNDECGELARINMDLILMSIVERQTNTKAEFEVALREKIDRVEGYGQQLEVIHREAVASQARYLLQKRNSLIALVGLTKLRTRLKEDAEEERNTRKASVDDNLLEQRQALVMLSNTVAHTNLGSVEYIAACSKFRMEAYDYLLWLDGQHYVYGSDRPDIHWGGVRDPIHTYAEDWRIALANIPYLMQSKLRYLRVNQPLTFAILVNSAARESDAGRFCDSDLRL